MVAGGNVITNQTLIITIKQTYLNNPRNQQIASCIFHKVIKHE